ncbi:hypothetical protein [Pseudarthrobacter sp. BRE9]|uniref:hypothetical protein n=1 Tax=Pseudarthrobacter sp. BRE9 TaxID=2962582 RepID=UPI00288117EA|nr:hypothetical protein [Pseudarthrobacter sp. BRE9]MDT0169357.1 hypothetical protein [Pseudarthrobacter sp. BRE9]
MDHGTDKESPEGRIDPRLLLLLTSVFSTGPDATLELTAVVDGIVISGSVVSEDAWTLRQNDQVRIGSPAIATALDSMASADPAESAAEGTSSQPAGHGRYLHFLSPVLLSGGVRVPLPATRVDLRKVAAWSIGRIQGD